MSSQTTFPETSPAAPQWNRWRTCRYVCSVLFLLVVTVEGAGFHRQDLTMQVVLVGGVSLIALLAVRWAAGALHRILLLYASCLFTFAIFEATLSLYPDLDPPTTVQHDSLFRFDDKLGWRLLPDSEAVIEMRGLYRTTVKTNSAGFRDPEAAREDQAPILAVLGDSFVSNFGVEATEVFTALMHKDLGDRVCVRNFGVNGYGQVQELLLLEEILTSHRPAMVLVVVYIRNDFDDNLGIFDWNLGYRRPQCSLTSAGQIEIERCVQRPALPQKLESANLLPLERAIASTRTYRLLTQVLGHAFPEQVALHLLPAELRYCKRELEFRERKAVELTTALLGAMERKCREHNCAFGVVLAPSLWQVQRREWEQLLADYRLDPRDYDRSLPNRLLATFCQQNDYLCLDLLPSLETAAAAGETLYFPREQHWNRRGQERVAEAIGSWVRSACGITNTPRPISHEGTQNVHGPIVIRKYAQPKTANPTLNATRR
jgi:hypothetical protein